MDWTTLLASLKFNWLPVVLIIVTARKIVLDLHPGKGAQCCHAGKRTTSAR
jgi:hypothetical protein